MYTEYWKESFSKILKFIKDNKQLILDGNFDELYRLSGITISASRFTGFLLYCNINPLKYLTEVPDDYAFYTGGEDTVVVPEHISVIQQRAFSSCVLDKLIIESKQPITINAHVFDLFQANQLVIKGEIAEVARNAFTMARVTIICSEETEDKIREKCVDIQGLSFERL